MSTDTLQASVPASSVAGALIAAVHTAAARIGFATAIAVTDQGVHLEAFDHPQPEAPGAPGHRAGPSACPTSDGGSTGLETGITPEQPTRTETERLRSAAMGVVESANIGSSRVTEHSGAGRTGIDKRPVATTASERWHGQPVRVLDLTP